jgi:ATP-binding protein involved in chromosome partitioning
MVLLTPTPKEIKRDDTRGILITWNDGSVSKLTSEVLRRGCPCAGCKEKRGDTTHAKPLTGKKRSLAIVENTLDQEIALQRIWGVGQYALGMEWGDGHSTGIYPFTYLREMAGQ